MRKIREETLFEGLARPRIARSVPVRALVEERGDFRARLRRGLIEAGFNVGPARARAEGVPAHVGVIPDAVVLDLTVSDDSALSDEPAEDGAAARLPTDRDDDQPAVMILGARNVRELVGYVGTILHAHAQPGAPLAVRTGAGRKTQRHVAGSLELDLETHRVRVDGAEVHVTAIEMRLLTYLLEHRGRAVPRGEILKHVFGYSPRARTRTADTHVKRLRGKLGSAKHLIQTVRGVGFRIAADAARSDGASAGPAERSP
jgi:two-component system phosphate regulon response regulator PhoB